MARDEWYRRTTWSPDDEADFERRLMRARSTSRNQYLRIQALHLAETGDLELTRIALRLLDRQLAEYPDHLDLPQAQLQRAEALGALGDWQGAVGAYRAAIEAQRRPRCIQTQAPLDFPWEVVRRGATELYGEVEAILDGQPEDDRPFPVQRFRWSAAKALIAEHRGEIASARRHATAALEAAAADRSGFRHHPSVGLVKQVDDTLRARLERLTRAG